MPEIPSSIMIFAAGFGTRMMPLTRDRPKPMVRVAGEPMIDRALFLTSDAGISNVVSNLHYKADVLEAHLHGRGVTILREEPDILDTGGGLKNALSLLGSDPVLTMNPDAIWNGPNPLTFAQSHWKPDQMDALLVCVSPENALGSNNTGDFTLDESGLISRGSDALYGGVQIIKTERLKEISNKVFSLNQLWDLLIEDSRCFGQFYPGKWCDVGHPGGISIAEEMIGWQSND
ncbi:MAG: nucleotidyltransferase family protein [Aliishimia sp.]